MRILLLSTVSALGMCLSASAKDIDTTKLPPPSDQKGVTYEKNVKPLLEQSCVKCHGPEKPKAKLRLDSLQGVLKGGEDGKVVEPGNSAKSVLIHNVAHLGAEDDWMPPPENKLKIKPLTNDQIGLLRAWIDQGAK